MLRRSSPFVLIASFACAVLLGLPAQTSQAAPYTITSPLPGSVSIFTLNPYQLRPAHDKPAAINAVPLDQIVVITPAVKANIRAIYASGLKNGNDPRAFSTLGDSSVAGGLFLERFGENDTHLGDYTFLTPTLQAFDHSFKRTSASVRIGLHSWTALNPVWADKKRCEPNENGIDCEFRLNKPSIMFIHLGANDTANNVFDKNMRKIVEHVIEAGVVPVLITKADGPGSKTRANNNSMRTIAGAYHVPLIDFEKLASTLPNLGLGPDQVHMTNFNKVDYRQPALFRSGHAMHNLAALIALDAIWRTATTID